ncbi:MAG TPA: alpha/beta fold hydrolase [Sporichthyaceae bacterium]|jgi:triacylglycerol esterase/lipase EstA (alpha/beta hydrolase family)|nr:alpha/beta fold hydrolase [Sporichthyaceae bacterium]
MSRKRIATAVLALVLGAAVAAPAPAVADDIGSTDHAWMFPEPKPDGMNDANCKPSAAHPRPVVLVHGLGATASENWHVFAPYLAQKGYCVYGLTYGQVPQWPSRGGVDQMETSALQLSAFVDKVLAVTGAKQVDMVGHSEGGIMPRWYLKFDGGGAKVAHFVAWAPPSHGTTVSGLTPLRAFWPGFDDQMGAYCQSCPEFMPGSAFLKKLNDGGDTVGNVNYTVIATRYDYMVTPIETAYLHGPNVTNILLQDVNPADISEHVALAVDPTVFGLTEKALATGAGPGNQ